MPEYPEVAVVLDEMIAILVGNLVTSVQVGPKLNYRGDESCVEGKIVSHFRQWGKFLIVFLKDPPKDGLQNLGHRRLRRAFQDRRTEPATGRSALVVHLGMSGMLTPLADGTEADPHRDAHVHARIHWESPDGAESGVIRFFDPRRFGRMWFCSRHTQLGKVLSKVGPDIIMLSVSKENSYSTSRMDLELGARRFVRRLREVSQDRRIKDVLMDQSVVSGFGNIYAAECLHRAGISPRRSLERIADAWLRLLYSQSVSLFMRARVAGGSSVHSFRGPTGKEGTAQELHAVYAREVCAACSSKVSSLRMHGRTTYMCKNCQK